MAIDLDADGHVWVLDSDGRLHVRGARMPAVFEGFRAGPPTAGATEPDDCEPPPANDPAWDVYFQQLGDTLAEAGKLCDPSGPPPLGPGLRPESIAEARSVGAGATIVMPPWDEFYAEPACTKKLAQQLLSKQRGVDVLFCLAPIFTRRPRVPPALIKALKLDSKKPDFANPGLMLGRRGARALSSPSPARAAVPAPELDPRTRGYLLALAELRKRRLTPTKRPWKARLGMPDTPSTQALANWQGGFAQRAPPGLEKITDPRRRFSPFVLEARVANALWTLVGDVDGKDVGVGRRSAWVASQSGGTVTRIDAVNGKIDPSTNFPGVIPAMRISVSRSPPDSKHPIERPWVVDTLGAVKALVDKSWETIGSPGAIDIATGMVAFGNLPAEGGHDVYRVNKYGQIDQLFVLDGLTGWVKVGWFNPVGKEWPVVTTVAVDRTDTEYATELWFIRMDDQIGWSKKPYEPIGVLPGGAWDVGAGGGDVWAVGNTEEATGKKGNSLWWLDRDANEWQVVAPGGAIAIDVDDAGKPWLLDGDGKLHVRGAMMPAVGEQLRGAPNPDLNQTWDDYFAIIAPYLADPPPPYTPTTLDLEATAALHLVGAGGSIHLLPWDVFASFTPTQRAFYKAQLEYALSRERGTEMVFCLAPIFTSRDRVPSQLRSIDGVVVDQAKQIINFAHPAILDAYEKTVLELAAVPGFKRRVRYFSIGNEVDVYLGGIPDPSGFGIAWQHYIDFCKIMPDKIRSVLPNAKVGVNWTLRGIEPLKVSVWQDMCSECDIVLVNYYAIGASAVLSDADYKNQFPGNLLTLGPGKPIVVQEIGMPSSVGLGGSEQQQLAFLSYVLDQWTLHGIPIRFLSWWPLYDYLYDPLLRAKISKNAQQIEFIEVTQSGTDPAGNTIPKVITLNGQTLHDDQGNPRPFWGAGHNFPLLFGSAPVTGKALFVEALKASVGLPSAFVEKQPGDWVRLCQFLSSCGLLRANGTRKPAWYKFQEWTAARRKQL